MWCSTNLYTVCGSVGTTSTTTTLRAEVTQADRAPEQLSAADASNSAKAKSANSVSLILVYIRLPGPAVQPHLLPIPDQDDRAQWRRSCRHSFTPSHPSAHTHPPTRLLSLTLYLREGIRQRKPQSLSCHLSSPLAPHRIFCLWLPFTPSPSRSSAPDLAPVLRFKLSSTAES